MSVYLYYEVPENIYLLLTKYEPSCYYRRNLWKGMLACCSWQQVGVIWPLLFSVAAATTKPGHDPLTDSVQNGLRSYNDAVVLPRSLERTSLLQNAIQLIPTHGHAYLNLGVDLHRSGRVLSALPILQTANMLMPTYPAAKHSLGSALLEARRPTEALDYLTAAVKLRPLEPAYVYQRGSALLALHRLEESAAEFKRVMALDPTFATRSERNDANSSLRWRIQHAIRSELFWSSLLRRSAGWPKHRTRSDTARTSLLRHGTDEYTGRSTIWPAASSSRTHALEWLAPAGNRQSHDGFGKSNQYDAQGVTSQRENPRICAVANASTPEKLETALEGAAAIGVPILLRQAAAFWGSFDNKLLFDLLADYMDDKQQRVIRTQSAHQSGGGGMIDSSLVESPNQCSAEEWHEGSDCALLRVSLLHADRSANRIVPLRSNDTISRDAAETSPRQPSRHLGSAPERLAAELESLGVHAALQRPRATHMCLATLLALLRSGECTSHCYLKQLRLDLYLPDLLRALHPPRLRSVGQRVLPLAEANLWLGAAPSHAPIRTDLHKDARPNILVVLRGRKRVLMVPPAESARLRPAKLLDVMSVLTNEAIEEDATSSRPLWPQNASTSLFDHQHYLMDLDEALASLHTGGPTDHALESAFQGSAQLLRAYHRLMQTSVSATASADEMDKPFDLASGSVATVASKSKDTTPPNSICSFVVEAPDALFIPPGWAHAVETDSENDDFSAAVNFFYDVPAHIICGDLGSGNVRLMGQSGRCP